MHCGNFGAFTDSQDRLVYDINDFDESVIADYQFDLWRLAISLVLLGKQNQLKPHHVKSLVQGFAKGYFHEIESCHDDGGACEKVLDHRNATGILKQFLHHTRRIYGKKKMLERWTEEIQGDLRFKVKANPDLEAIPAGLAPLLRDALEEYADHLKPWPLKSLGLFEVKDLAQRLHQGVGARGLNRYYALLKVEAGPKEKYRILDIKLQPKPSPWAFLPSKAKEKTKEACDGDHGLRTALAFQALGQAVDPWLGWLKLEDGEYSVRERSPYKAVLAFNQMDAGLSRQLGEILARAHCRAKKKFALKAWDRLKEKEAPFAQALQVIAHAYADQVELDYQSFISAPLR